MTKEEILGYIGAAAWIPQIIAWLYQAYITPRLQIISGRFASIGYTRFGPIFNLNLAFSAQRKAAIIELLEAAIIHEDGERHMLRMEGMSETMSDIADAAGNKTTVSKEQITLVFKVGTEALLEKFVRFQEEKFHNNLEPLVQIGADIVQFERQKGGDYFSRIVGMKEFRDIVTFNQSYFWWKTGKYSVEFKMKSPETFRLKKTRFHFTLNQIDVDMLRANISQLANEYENVVRAGEQGFEMKPIAWNWRSVKIESGK